VRPIADAARHVLLAVQFYTRLPVRGRVAAFADYRPDRMPHAAAHLPFVGAVVGLAAAATGAAALLLWPPVVAAVLATVATVVLTGAFHEDGLADTADALGGHVPRERALTIMTDSRLGSYGAVALVLVLLTKVAALAAVAADGAAALAAGLVLAHVLSRLGPLLVMRRLPYVGGESGKAKPMAEHLPRSALVVAVAWTAPALVLAVLAHGPVRAVVVVVVVLAVAVAATRWLRSRLQGFTGDTLGATQQVGEVAVYLVLAAAVV
jgi:adenosylcobinamide-GDP ribazoletransferase